VKDAGAMAGVDGGRPPATASASSEERGPEPGVTSTARFKWRPVASGAALLRHRAGVHLHPGVISSPQPSTRGGWSDDELV
jgi:hypothetical protein